MIKNLDSISNGNSGEIVKNSKENITSEEKKEFSPDEIKEILKEIEGLVNNADEESLKEAEKKLALIEKQMNEVQEKMKQANEEREK